MKFWCEQPKCCNQAACTWISGFCDFWSIMFFALMGFYGDGFGKSEVRCCRKPDLIDALIPWRERQKRGAAELPQTGLYPLCTGWCWTALPLLVFSGWPLYFFCRVVIWCRCAVLQTGHFRFSAWKSAFWKAGERLSCNRNVHKTKKQQTRFAKQWQCFICGAFSIPLSAFSHGQTALLLSNESSASVTLMLLSLSGGQPGDLRTYFSGIQVTSRSRYLVILMCRSFTGIAFGGRRAEAWLLWVFFDDMLICEMKEADGLLLLWFF